jgi:GxxExxY protein
MAMPYERDVLTDQIIGFAIEVHRHLGPGLLESAYEECLCYELNENGMAFKRQVPLRVVYKSVRLDCGYRIDLVVENRLILELKATERLLPIHEAQVLTYMRLSSRSTGLLLNFNTPVLKDGIRRLML